MRDKQVLTFLSVMLVSSDNFLKDVRICPRRMVCPCHFPSSWFASRSRKMNSFTISNESNHSQFRNCLCSFIHPSLSISRLLHIRDVLRFQFHLDPGGELGLDNAIGIIFGEGLKARPAIGILALLHDVYGLIVLVLAAGKVFGI